MTDLDVRQPASATTRGARADLIEHNVFSSSVSAPLARLRSYLMGPPLAVEREAHTPGPTATTYVVARSSHAGVVELQSHAWTRLRIAEAEGTASPTPEALGSLKTVIGRFVVNDGPTPQLGPTGDGSVELRWLVAGRLVSALFEESGEFNLYAIEPDESVIFDEDIPFGESVPAEVQDRLREVLAEMSRHVAIRPPTWH
jgi:hypothetical protein